MKKFLLLPIILITLFACTSKHKPAPQLSKEQLVLQELDSLKRLAQTGDLVVRAGDDLLSYQIKFLNEADKSYSHAGMIVERDGQKLVAHITPDDSTVEGVHYVPIDTFLSPQKNLSCALYRYQSNNFEGKKVAAAIESYRQAGVRFDRLYDLTTDNSLYCSEMISKALAQSTEGEIVIKTAHAPKEMRKAAYLFFQKKLPMDTIAQRSIITIDNLYRHPSCRLIMAFPLKYFPGQ